MIRALLPVTFALSLAVAAGILLTQNGVFSGSDSGLNGVSAASSGGSCCSKARAKKTTVPLAIAESSCCNKETIGEVASCSGGECHSLAAFASMSTDGEEKACSAGGCPFAAPSTESKCCSQGNKCCSGEAKTYSAEAGTDGAQECSKKDAGECCSEGETCASKEKNQTTSEDAVATLAD